MAPFTQLRGAVRRRIHAVMRLTVDKEAKRLSVLRATGLLEAGRVPSLDRLTGLAARLVAVPTAAVTLIEADHQRLASACGLAAGADLSRRTPLSYSYCKHVVQDDAPLI